MDENEPSDEETQRLPSDTLRNVAIALDRKAITVQFHVQPPQQPTAIERHATHKDIQQHAGDIPVLAKRIRRIERT